MGKQMTKVSAKLSKNGFYFGSVEINAASAAEAANAAVALIAEHAANGVSVTDLIFS